MAASPAAGACSFLRDLAQRARARTPSATWPSCATSPRSELGLPDLQAWDLAFASEKLKEARYAFSDQEVKQYFTEPTVLAGLFEIVETLFEVHDPPDQAPVWHASVRFYRIERDGRLLAPVLPRPLRPPRQAPGAWMDDVRVRWVRPDGALQTPVATWSATSRRRSDGQPALLTHDDVITLFHEFGHGLHHMLTQVDDLGVSGICGVEWDAVELPSQFMENFCWEWEVLQRLTAHVDTGAAAAARAVRQDARGEELPERAADAAPGRVRAVRHAHPRRAGAAERVQQVLDEVRARGRGVAAAGLQPLPAQLLAHLCRRLRGRLLQLQMGRGAVGRRLERVRGSRRAVDVATGRRYREEILEAGGSRRRWRTSWPSAAANRASMRCCATRAWLESCGPGRLDCRVMRNIPC